MRAQVATLQAWKDAVPVDAIVATSGHIEYSKAPRSLPGRASWVALRRDAEDADKMIAAIDTVDSWLETLGGDYRKVQP